MSAVLEETSTVEEKARELCEFIADQPAFAAAHESIEAFLEDDDAKALYQQWQEKNRELHQLGHQGQQPTAADMAEMESLRSAVLSNPLATGFIEAEDQMNEIFSTVTKLLQKTLQTGRVPSAEEIADSGCCNSGGCGCH